MPQITYGGYTKEGLLLYYDSQNEDLVLPYVHSLAPESYTVYKAADKYGSIEPAWSVTDLGWTTLKSAISSVVYQYATDDVPYDEPVEMAAERFTVKFDPD